MTFSKSADAVTHGQCQHSLSSGHRLDSAELDDRIFNRREQLQKGRESAQLGMLLGEHLFANRRQCVLCPPQQLQSFGGADFKTYQGVLRFGTDVDGACNRHYNEQASSGQQNRKFMNY